ncbi:MAG TPA: ribbon-helix-helix protein, CopG family [Candidatus Sulfotelmatobacter sp.]|nr:ribbon-helix-helix protein, CopG family [Candidatus Sulfotelmatobacter sp.]
MSREVVTVTIPSEVVKKLDEVAQSEYRSRSSLVTALLAKGLESRTESQEPVMAQEVR